MNGTTRIFFGVLGIVAMLATGLANATPELRSGQIKYGSSIRAPENGWAIFAYRLRNSDKEPATVRLQVRPERQRGGVIFDHEVTIPAETRMTNEIPVTTTQDDTYVCDLFFEGNLVSSTPMLITTATPSERILLVLNDSDVGIGSLSRNDNLHGQYKTSPSSFKNAPENWAGYDRVTAVIATQPNWQQMTARQTQALQDYVERGGTLIVVDPHGATAMANSPLAHLLPATPLRLRPTDRIPASSVPGSKADALWPDGIDFLESQPLPDARVTRQLDGYPLVVWRRYGLGRVVMSCAHPTAKGLTATMSDAWWRHLLRFSGSGMLMQSSHGSRPLARAVDTLTGLRIPSRGPIMAAALGYLAFAGIVILLGIVTRRRLTSWLVLCTTAMVGTIVIFVIAGGQHDNRAPRSASLIAFGDPDNANEQIISLFSSSETRLTMAAADAESRIRDIPAPPRDTRITNRPAGPSAGGPRKPGQTREAKEVEVRDPLGVTMREGKPHLEDALLRGNAVRMHAVLNTGTLLEARTDSPALPPTGKGNWTIPPKFAGSTGAAVILNSGITAATVNGQQVTFAAGLEPDLKPPTADLANIRQAVAERNLPTPILLLSQPLTGEAVDYHLPAEFELSGRRINLIAMHEVVAAETALPYGRMPVRPEGGLARSIHNQDGWSPMQQRTNATTYELITYMPLSLLCLDVSAIRLKFVADNRGLNVKFDLKLRPYDTPESNAKNKHADKNDLAASAQSEDVWTFTTDDAAKFIDPSDGRIRIALTASPIKKIIDPVAQQRANTWTVRQFEGAVDGTLAPEWNYRRAASKDAPKP